MIIGHFQLKGWTPVRSNPGWGGAPATIEAGVTADIVHFLSKAVISEKEAEEQIPEIVELLSVDDIRVEEQKVATPMPLSEFSRKLVETLLVKFCESKVPVTTSDEVRLEFKIEGNNVTLCETRLVSRHPSVWSENPVARFRFDDKTKKWDLYCCCRKSKWYLYEGMDSSANFEDLLKEVDRDPSGIFWG